MILRVFDMSLQCLPRGDKTTDNAMLLSFKVYVSQWLIQVVLTLFWRAKCGFICSISLRDVTVVYVYKEILLRIAAWQQIWYNCYNQRRLKSKILG